MVHTEVIANATPSSFGVKIKEKKTTSTTTKREGKTGAGSRRIFSPIFKLQVLDSYRTDADCQGNQRATARKYGIHRRQIQKWLQMEETLRTSVRQQQQQQQQANAVVAATPTSSVLNLAAAAASDANCNRVLKSSIIMSTSTSSSVEKAPPKRTPIDQDEPSPKETAVVAESEEYVNVDEITDSEEDSSSCSSLGKGWSSSDEHALDFTNATLSKRRFYSDEFKSHVLDVFRNGDPSCKGNQKTIARKFGIRRRQIQKWLDRESLSSLSPPKVDHLRRGCLDLSSATTTAVKRKSETPEIEPDAKRSPAAIPPAIVQESALCLVKDECPEKSVCQFPVAAVSPPFLCPLEHSAAAAAAVVNYASSYHHRPEYSLPFCVYQQPPPWSCCYQQIAAAAASSTPSVRSNLDGVGGNFFAPKYSSYSLNLKYETSYVDIPVQYGFGDSVPSKWLKQSHPPPFYTHEYPRIQLLSSYR